VYMQVCEHLKIVLLQAFKCRRIDERYIEPFWKQLPHEYLQV
jgi:hypothetical protein